MMDGGGRESGREGGRGAGWTVACGGMIPMWVHSHPMIHRPTTVILWKSSTAETRTSAKIKRESHERTLAPGPSRKRATGHARKHLECQSSPVMPTTVPAVNCWRRRPSPNQCVCSLLRLRRCAYYTDRTGRCPLAAPRRPLAILLN
jgi:hypothetical protein